MPKNGKTAINEFMEKCAKTFGTAEQDFVYIYGDDRFFVNWGSYEKPYIGFKVNNKTTDKFIYIDGSRYVTAKKEFDIVYDILCDNMYMGGDIKTAIKAMKKQLNQ